MSFGTLPLKSLALLLLTVLAAACGTDRTPVSRVADAEADKAAWIEKVATALRHGNGIGDQDDMDALLAMSREDIVAKMMADERFGDTVLAFNMFYLGRSVNQLKTPVTTNGVVTGYQYASMVQSMPQALASAHAVVTGGDFFEIYSGDPALLVAPLKKPSAPDLEADLTDEQKRAKLKADALAQFDTTLATFTVLEGGSIDKQSGCNNLYNLGYTISQKLTQAGFESRIGDLVQQRWLGAMQSYPNGDCYNAAVTGDVVIAKVKKIKDATASLFATAASMPQGDGLRSLADLAKVSTTTEGLPGLSEAMTQEGFWNKLNNSSTNYNRKRSAYMLRTYFCDELSPINVAAPADHGEGAHGTEPACMACHYKLDPMGGLFRDHGQAGTSYKGQDSHTFDDFKTISGDDKKKFMKTWQNDMGAWQVGYFVGAGKPHAKWQGDKLEDLWPFLKQSAEAKSCLVRRMAEYFLGADQVYDGGWLEQIAKPLKAGPTSATAFKGVVTKLVTSNTFAHQDPDQGECYDFADGEEEGERAPCAIAHIVKKRCATCHSDAAETGVDFTKWVELADGKFGFPHLGADGAQRTQAESFQLILDRITSADPEIRMPLNSSMPEMDRQILYKWLSNTLNPN